MLLVVFDATKVQIFKQITTWSLSKCCVQWLFLMPQRYRFSSKSQPYQLSSFSALVVFDATKVQIFKQITTEVVSLTSHLKLFLMPQRYRFSSKSQHNWRITIGLFVVFDATKVQIFKQITTPCLTLTV